MVDFEGHLRIGDFGLCRINLERNCIEYMVRQSVKATMRVVDANFIVRFSVQVGLCLISSVRYFKSQQIEG